jgi:glucose/mannose-6-phosphate isomerase
MREDIYNFPQQLLFSPEIKNEEKWGGYGGYVLAGMGGSHLSGDILRATVSGYPLFLHQNYGLPTYSLNNMGVVAASYSGNTEETLDAFERGVVSRIPIIAISKGGKLIEKAKENNTPFIELPQNDTQPRVGVGYAFKALLKALKAESLAEEVVQTSYKLEKRKDDLEKQGKELVSFVKNKVPIVYASSLNEVLAKIWKINFNEGPKIPSFFNTIPELNHNEMTGFDVVDRTKDLSENMVFISLLDKEDYERNRKRADVLKKVLEKRGFSFLQIEVEGDSRTEKLFSSVVLSAWIAYYLSQEYNINPNEVPMVEEFKKEIK